MSTIGYKYGMPSAGRSIDNAQLYEAMAERLRELGYAVSLPGSGVSVLVEAAKATQQEQSSWNLRLAQEHLLKVAREVKL